MRDIDKMFLAIVFASVIIIFICGILDSRPESSWTSDLSVAQPPPYEPRIVIDLGAAVKLTNVSVTNITVYIDENQSRNVTIWKGNEMVCYIPRS
jgi:hypothetical protein